MSPLPHVHPARSEANGPRSEADAALPALATRLWTELAEAAGDRQHGWRLMALATLAHRGPQNTPMPELRHVVLREVDAAARSLVFYTDARSPKVTQMLHHPQGSLLVWCPRLGWQLRLQVQLAVQTSGLAVSSRWARLKLTPAAHDYLSPLPPGAPLPVAPDPGSSEAEGLPAAGATPASAASLRRADGAVPMPAPELTSRSHFAMVHARVLQMDWLDLAPEGHRRAVFDAQGQGEWRTP